MVFIMLLIYYIFLFNVVHGFSQPTPEERLKACIGESTDHFILQRRSDDVIAFYPNGTKYFDFSGNHQVLGECLGVVNPRKDHTLIVTHLNEQAMPKGVSSGRSRRRKKKKKKVLS
ncbi:hypothetical protein OXX80_003750 [Metschnikowia pulcherrima]